eukprot:COSAG05_NODE_1471_length_4792_cov_14.769444_4_plen_72_part_00
MIPLPDTLPQQNQSEAETAKRVLGGAQSYGSEPATVVIKASDTTIAHLPSTLRSVHFSNTQAVVPETFAAD